MGFIFPDAGQIDRHGLPVTGIGYLPERAFYPPRFSIRDYLATLSRLAGVPPATGTLLAQVGLEAAGSRRLGACSRGMLQRVGLAQAMLGDPGLLLLDEPALGLDPAGQKFMREQILALHRAGKTVILSSHQLDEVTRVCTHVAVLSQGRLIRSGPLEAMLAERSQVVITTSPLPPGLDQELESQEPGVSATAEQVVLFGPAIAHKARILRCLIDAGVDVRRLSEERVTLEEVYLEATTP
ncbi:MAG: ABC transporter ATP-binding protein [Chloroflexi bacterium]|nr:MAG: ABC transporter ATP-binding protein [Chloroflexota bacterium]